MLITRSPDNNVRGSRRRYTVDVKKIEHQCTWLLGYAAIDYIGSGFTYARRPFSLRGLVPFFFYFF